MSATRGECGCDMRGMLSFQILFLLSKKQMHGEEIADEIGKRRGEKPNPGTIYPALKDLKENGLIEGKKSGKTVIYSITKEGKSVYRESRNYFLKCFGDIFVHRL